MKRLLSCLTGLVLACCVICMSVSLPVTAAPAAKLVAETIEYLPDGGWVVTSVYEDSSFSDISVYGTSTKNGTKTQTGYDNNGAVKWTFTVHGTFSVTPGVSAVCQSASYSYTTPGSGWSLDSGSAYPSGNQAIGNAKFVRKILGVTVETDNVTCVLSCDVNGNLS